MAAHLTDRLQALLKSADLIRESPRAVLEELVSAVNQASGDESDRGVQDCVLRALEWREAFGSLAPIVDSLAKSRGLYPYIESEGLSVQDLLSLEVHRPLHLEEFVLHSAQLEIYSHLLNGENIILSAPTSFGKSLLVDALIATGNYRNVVVVVPTIALIDEVRRRLSSRFGDRFKVITHVSQSPGEQNLYVFTQERALEYENFGKLDLFVIDEFYKLDPRRDPDRSYLLNQVLYRLFKTGAQFYLLGPNIKQLPLDLPGQLRCRFISTDYNTVVSERILVPTTKADRLQKLVDIARELVDPTLIYCASPASARRVAVALVGAGLGNQDSELEVASEWVATQYHPEWIFARALGHGIGVHHGKVPRALAQYAVRQFNAGRVRFLVCTSTLIEGVNTKAKNVIVYDNKVATKKFDFFTFNNIQGRSGRMFHHYVGRVFLFDEPPQEGLPLVDMPAFTQPDDTPASLLIQIDDSDMSEKTRAKLQPLWDQQLLSLETIRSNRGIEPDAQLDLAEHIANDPDRASAALSWKGFPEWEELVVVCELIWRFFIPQRGRVAGVASGKQLAYRVSQFRKGPNLRNLVLREVAEQDEPDADGAVEDVLEFVRYWATFHFPRLLMAVQRIQAEVLGRASLPFGDYSAFAAMVENQFAKPGIAALDEYGIPIQVGRRLWSRMGQPDSVDEAIAALAKLTPGDLLDLDEFERTLVLDAANTLGPPK